MGGIRTRLEDANSIADIVPNPGRGWSREKTKVIRKPMPNKITKVARKKWGK